MISAVLRPFQSTILIAGIASAFFSGTGTAQEKTADWPQFRGPGGMGVSAATGLPTTWGPQKNLVWKKELPGPGASSPVIVGKRIFLTCSTGSGDELQRRVLCLALDGNILWNKEVKSKLPEKERIRENHGYASSTPAANAEQLFVFFGKTGVLAFDHDGNQQWTADVGDRLNGWGSAASPVLYRNLVIVNASVESESLFARDQKKGTEVWRAKGIRESWNTPILLKTQEGKAELVVAIFRKILGFDPVSGEQLWSCDTEINWYMAPSMVAHDGVVYSIGGRSGVAALAVRAGGRGDVTKTHRLWTGRKGSNVSSPIYHDGHLYWFSDTIEMAYCADAKTGKIVYEERLPRAGQFYASPILADGKIFCVSRHGEAFVLAAQPKFEQLAANDPLERGMFNASPAIAGGRLYLRSDRFLYCIGSQGSDK